MNEPPVALSQRSHDSHGKICKNPTYSEIEVSFDERLVSVSVRARSMAASKNSTVQAKALAEHINHVLWIGTYCYLAILKVKAGHTEHKTSICA